MELTGVLAFHGHHASASGTVIVGRVPGLLFSERWPSRLVATAEENQCEVELQLPKAWAGRFTQQALRFGFSAT
jgi:hypothetical protein